MTSENEAPAGIHRGSLALVLSPSGRDKPPTEYVISTMKEDPTVESKIQSVRSALDDHFRKDSGDYVRSLDVVRVIRRAFSALAVLNVQTAESRRVLVMKTVIHHPIIKATTERNNQAVVEYNILQFLYPKFREVPKCGVPRPVLVVPEVEALVMDFVEGHPLVDECRHERYFSSWGGFQRLREHYFYCGKWLKHFKEFTGSRTAGPEAYDGVIERCDLRLRRIEESSDPRCPNGLRGKVMKLLEEQRSRLQGGEVLVSGRHGDFGSWNVIAGPHGVTVLDFLGYEEGPFAVDLLNMLMNFEDEKRYLAYSPRRVEALRQSFLEGFGPLPCLPEANLILCEALHRVCSVWACVSSREARFHRRFERRLCLKANLDWLTNHRKRRLLWPACSVL